MKITALIPAAGRGRRMGAQNNKQYLMLGDRPVLAHTLNVFERHPEIDRVVLIIPEAEIDFCLREVVKKYDFQKVFATVPGGPERQDSVRFGLDALSDDPDDLVLVHDGARPFLSRELLDRVVVEAFATGACLAAVPVKDTVKAVTKGRVDQTLPRQTLWQAQTPQAFHSALLRRAHSVARKEGYMGTDDAELVERLGHPVAVVMGDYQNFKITTPDDLVAAQTLISAQS